MSCHTNEEERRARDEIENYQRFSHAHLGLTGFFYIIICIISFLFILSFFVIL